jgi:hypothetical protein
MRKNTKADDREKKWKEGMERICNKYLRSFTEMRDLQLQSDKKAVLTVPAQVRLLGLVEEFESEEFARFCRTNHQAATSALEEMDERLQAMREADADDDDEGEEEDDDDEGEKENVGGASRKGEEEDDDDEGEGEDDDDEGEGEDDDDEEEDELPPTQDGTANDFDKANATREKAAAEEEQKKAAEEEQKKAAEAERERAAEAERERVEAERKKAKAEKKKAKTEKKQAEAERAARAEKREAALAKDARSWFDRAEKVRKETEEREKRESEEERRAEAEKQKLTIHNGPDLPPKKKQKTPTHASADDLPPSEKLLAQRQEAAATGTKRKRDIATAGPSSASLDAEDPKDPNQTTLTKYFKLGPSHKSGVKARAGGASLNDDNSDDMPPYQVPGTTPTRASKRKSSADEAVKVPATEVKGEDFRPRGLGLAVEGRNYSVAGVLWVEPRPCSEPEDVRRLQAHVLELLVLDTKERRIDGWENKLSCRTLVPVKTWLKHELPVIPGGMIDAMLVHGHRNWRTKILAEPPSTAVGGVLSSLVSHSFHSKLRGILSLVHDVRREGSLGVCPDLWFMLRGDPKNPKPNAQVNKEPRCGYDGCADSATMKKLCPSAPLRDAACFFDDKPDPAYRAYYNPHQNRLRVAVLRTPALPRTFAGGSTSAAPELIEIDLNDCLQINDGGGVSLLPLLATLQHYRVEALVSLEAPPRPGADVFPDVVPLPTVPLSARNLSKSLPGYFFHEVTLREILPKSTCGLPHCGLFRPQLEVLFQPHHYGPNLTARFGDGGQFSETALIRDLGIVNKIRVGKWDGHDIKETLHPDAGETVPRFYFPWAASFIEQPIKAVDSREFVAQYNAQIAMYPHAHMTPARVVPPITLPPPEQPPPEQPPQIAASLLVEPAAAKSSKKAAKNAAEKDPESSRPPVKPPAAAPPVKPPAATPHIKKVKKQKDPKPSVPATQPAPLKPASPPGKLVTVISSSGSGSDVDSEDPSDSV